MIPLISVVIRTQPGRESFLRLALFSLASQLLPPDEIIVIAHTPQDAINENSEQLVELHKLIDNFKIYFSSIDLLTHATTGDGRTVSLNLGLEKVTGRYLSFLDDDDVLYEHHFQVLIQALVKCENAWAIANVVRAGYRQDGQGYTLRERSEPFRRSGYSFLDHLYENFIPIHSFVLDMDRCPRDARFNENLVRHEDYEYLLRLAAKFPPIFLNETTAEYRIRLDGTNSILDGSDTMSFEEYKKKKALWERSNAVLDQVKKELVGWWAFELREVSDKLGRVSDFLSTTDSAKREEEKRRAQKMVDEIWQSTSWRLTSVIRLTMSLIRRSPIPKKPKVHTLKESHLVVNDIKSSLSWRITSPIREFKNYQLKWGKVHK